LWYWGLNLGPCNIQALYCFSQVSSSFCFSYFLNSVLCSHVGWTQTSILLLMPTIGRLQLGLQSHIITPDFFVEMGSCYLFAMTSLNRDPPDFHFLHSWFYRCMLCCPD
jgi:hypothetical protein